MRGQQCDRWETANSMLARGQPKNVMRRRKRGNKNDTVDRTIIWRNAQVTWEETQLPGNFWLYCSIPGGVRISMEEYLMGVLDNFPEEIT